MKFLHLFTSFLFLLFAYWQWNDPDSLIWIILYLVIAGIAFLAFQKKYFFKTYAMLTIMIAIPTLLYVPDVTQWIRDGMPSITESMKASSPYIELVREFFGLFISLVAMCIYLALAKKQAT